MEGWFEATTFVVADDDQLELSREEEQKAAEDGRMGEARNALVVRSADAVFIAVGTPSRRGDGHADLSYVYSAAREIAEALTGPAVIVTKSTVPVGTGDEVERIVREAAPDIRTWVVSNPEFLREGAAIEDFKRPDRIVVGTDDPEVSADHLAEWQKYTSAGFDLQMLPGSHLFLQTARTELLQSIVNSLLPHVGNGSSARTSAKTIPS